MHERATVLHHFESTSAPGTSISLSLPSSSRSSSAVSLCRELCRRRNSWKQGNLLINEVAVFVCTCLFHLKHFPSSSSPPRATAQISSSSRKVGTLTGKANFIAGVCFLTNVHPKKREKSGKRGPGGPSPVETFQIPVARWMFKKRNYSLGFFLGAR